MTVSASNLPDLGEGGQARVNISKFSPTNSRGQGTSTSASWSRCGWLQTSGKGADRMRSHPELRERTHTSWTPWDIEDEKAKVSQT